MPYIDPIIVNINSSNRNINTFLQLVESNLAHNTINVIYNYPKEQSALAKTIEHGLPECSGILWG